MADAKTSKIELQPDTSGLTVRPFGRRGLIYGEHDGVLLLPTTLRIRELLNAEMTRGIFGIRHDRDIAAQFEPTASRMETEELVCILENASPQRVVEAAAYYKAILKELCQRFQIDLETE